MDDGKPYGSTRRTIVKSCCHTLVLEHKTSANYQLQIGYSRATYGANFHCLENH